MLNLIVKDHVSRPNPAKLLCYNLTFDDLISLNLAFNEIFKISKSFKESFWIG